MFQDKANMVVVVEEESSEVAEKSKKTGPIFYCSICNKEYVNLKYKEEHEKTCGKNLPVYRIPQHPPSPVLFFYEFLEQQLCWKQEHLDLFFVF